MSLLIFSMRCKSQYVVNVIEPSFWYTMVSSWVRVDTVIGFAEIQRLGLRVVLTIDR